MDAVLDDRLSSTARNIHSAPHPAAARSTTSPSSSTSCGQPSTCRPPLPKRGRHRPRRCRSRRTSTPCRQLLLQHLAHRVAGQRVHHAHLARPLVHRKLLRDIVDQRPPASASPTTNATMRWPRSSSGTPTTAASAHAGVAEQRGLDLPRADAVAAGLDQVDRLAADDAVHARRRRSPRRRRCGTSRRRRTPRRWRRAGRDSRRTASAPEPEGAQWFPRRAAPARRRRRPAGSARRRAEAPPSPGVVRRRRGCSA